MTAVANPPSFANLNRPAWGINGGQSLNTMNPDEVRGMFAPRKPIPRTNSSSSVSSSSSASSTGTVTSAPQASANGMPAAADSGGWPSATPRKRPQPKGQWPAGKPEGPPGDFGRMPAGRPPMSNGVGGVSSAHQPSSLLSSQGQMMSQAGMSRPGAEVLAAGGQPVLYLLSLNGTFERKTISVPFYPDTLRIGRQTNAKTVPTAVNGFFDSKVLSRQHAEIWADRSGKIWIRDVKSSNGTFVNGTRLSQENRESEPHELQTQDHLELGIDIVSEDQKTVVHHKVAAKVEHAGFASPSNTLIDTNFGDLDPSSGGMAPLGGMPFRGRTSSQASINARMGGQSAGLAGAQATGITNQRQYWLNPVTTEHIVKRLHNEMRNARLQSQDLNRTGQFINALLSKDDIKTQEKPDPPEPQKAPLVNGSAVSFRSDAGKTRFSDPPAPPPSQPLPEKPDVARPHNPDVPSLKRIVTERPKSHPTNPTAPARQDNLNQILQLTEALNSAKKEIDSHNARVRELEEMFHKEREARLRAEDVVLKMEETKTAKTNGPAGTDSPNGHSELDTAFDPPAEIPPKAEPGVDSNGPSQPDRVEAVAAGLQAKIDSMVMEMKGVREQLDSFKQRAEKAETERDASQKTLAEMVVQIRRRDEEERKRSAERKSRSPSTGRSHSTHTGQGSDSKEKTTPPNGTVTGHSSHAHDTAEGPEDAPTLSRANTIKPSTGALGQPIHDQALIQSLPYASMIGVVLLGMGLMAYINGWQPHPRVDR